MITVDIRAGQKVESKALNARLSLADGALELEPRLDGAVAVARSEAQVGRLRLAPGARRLLRPGDVLELSGTQFAVRADRAAPQTVQLAKAMLRGGAEAAPASVPSLLWLNGPELGKRVALAAEATYLGRGDGCAARVADAQVSRMHAKIVKTAAGFRLEDLMSANGVFVDGEKLAAPRLLLGREVIQIGATLVAFELPASMQPAQTEPQKPDAGKPDAGKPDAGKPAPAKPSDAEPAPDQKRKRTLAGFEVALFGLALAALGAGGAVIAWALR